MADIVTAGRTVFPDDLDRPLSVEEVGLLVMLPHANPGVPAERFKRVTARLVRLGLLEKSPAGSVFRTTEKAEQLLESLFRFRRRV